MRQPLDSRQQNVRRSYILLFMTIECLQSAHSIVFYSFSPDQKLNPYFVFKA